MFNTLRAATRRRPRRLCLEPFEDRLAPAVSAGFQLVNDWGAGFQAAIRITNDQPVPVPDWRLEFDFAHQISQIWNGVIASREGGRYVVHNAGYNGTIPAHGSVEFGFLGTPGNVSIFPSNYLLNGAPLGGGPLATVAVGSVTVTEGDGESVTARFPITLSAPAAYPVTVQYATGDGTARAGLDYVAASGSITFQPGETVKEIPVTVRGDVVDEDDETVMLTLSSPIGAVLGTAQGQGLILDNDPPPSLRVSDVTIQEPSAGIAPGYFRTSGNQIVDAAGRPVRIAGVNWFGMETDTFSPHGLWARGYREMMDQMVQLGFNTIRLPFSSQLFDPGSVPSGIDFAKNPDLQGLSGLGILDRIVDYAGQVGLRIILDHHRSTAGGGAQEGGLWHTPEYPESRWIADWQMLAARYAGNPTVIGADLHNEPHGPAAWGIGGANDWRLAAERAGNAILAVNPDWLIIVEGVQFTAAGGTWWGGNLSQAGAFPVRLDVPGRLVYSPHDYPASVYPQSWFSDPNYPNNLYALWDTYWGYLFRQDIAPVLLGEFGTKLETASDRQWLDAMTRYLAGDLNGDGTSDLPAGRLGVSWTWWSWNPNSGDTGGILRDDWTSVNQAKVDAVAGVMFPWSVASGPTTATFTVTLSAPSSRPITVHYSTADDTAIAGQDYTAVAGTLTFAPGETSKTVSVPILADDEIEPAETFLLHLADPTNATLADAAGTATIQTAAVPPLPPDETPRPGVQVTFDARSDWGAGFVADLTIANTGTTALTGWTLEFDLDRDIVHIWNAEIVSRVGNRYTIRAAAWNGTVPAGGRAEFGFQGAAGNVGAGPQNYVLNGVPLP